MLHDYWLLSFFLILLLVYCFLKKLGHEIMERKEGQLGDWGGLRMKRPRHTVLQTKWKESVIRE